MVDITVKVTQGKVKVFGGPNDEPRDIFEQEHTISEGSEKKMNFTASNTSRIYIGIERVTKEAICQVNYAHAGTTVRQSRVPATSLLYFLSCFLVVSLCKYILYSHVANLRSSCVRPPRQQKIGGQSGCRCHWPMRLMIGLERAPLSWRFSSLWRCPYLRSLSASDWRRCYRR